MKLHDDCESNFVRKIATSMFEVRHPPQLFWHRNIKPLTQLANTSKQRSQLLNLHDERSRGSFTKLAKFQFLIDGGDLINQLTKFSVGFIDSKYEQDKNTSFPEERNWKTDKNPERRRKQRQWYLISIHLCKFIPFLSCIQGDLMS